MRVTINDKKLTEAQAMALHVAIGNMIIEFEGNPCVLGDDEIGKNLRDAYIIRLREIESFLID